MINAEGLQRLNKKRSDNEYHKIEKARILGTKNTNYWETSTGKNERST